MKLPKSIKVGDEIYQIKFRKLIRCGLGPGVVGLTDPNDRIIYLKRGQTSSELMTTFIHEILHAINFEYEIKIKHKLIYNLEGCIYQVIIDNFFKVIK